VGCLEFLSLDGFPSLSLFLFLLFLPLPFSPVCLRVIRDSVLLSFFFVLPFDHWGPKETRNK